ncbi:MAG: low molecular weight phosphatase family protein [Caulobacteraceae bacterium]
MDPAQPPRAVLFACNLNRVRSVMAAALLERAHGRRIVVDSCGLLPGEGVDPFAWAVMAEIGVDLTDHASKTIMALDPRQFDLVVSLTPETQRYGEQHLPGVQQEYWPIPDPTAVEGSRDQRMDAYREVRDDLARRLAERFPAPTAISK